ncbi:CpaF/VirB11 family protein [Spongiactinospora sp. TRM90649]|uniref:CpaF family protein n=1 Tax=Spongiactinospora sp. TRM90649 TaxID=3031114 RepID=UPI0023F88B39|nr:CpaF/VirB11 family protein [Spongiactinospora sp. TRM90649]MDF5759047.1 CpaF/VirB11 family protein [Spongiactinospora sp. TRM90649]
MSFDAQQAVREVLPRVTEALDEAEGVGDEAIREYAKAAITDLVREYADGRALAGKHTPTLLEERVLTEAVYNEIFALGRLQPFVDDAEVENIDVNGCDQVWITYRDGRKELGPPIADSDEELVGNVRRWAAYQGQTARDFSIARPRLHLSVGHRTRIAALMGVTPRPSLSIRRHGMLHSDLDDLMAAGTLDKGLRAFLAAAVRAHKDIVITGGMGDGKTTFARALAAEIDPDERIATVEKEYELFLHRQPDRHRDVLALEARESNTEGLGAITMHHLIEDALRFNVRRIIVGEVRGDELVPMLEAMNTGGSGSICTMHADSADQVFARMLILAGSGGLAIAPDTLFRTIGMAVDFVIHLRHELRHDIDGPVNRRFVAEVHEVLPPGDGREPAVNRVYVPGPDGRAVPNTMPQCMPELADAGFDPGLFTHWGYA